VILLRRRQPVSPSQEVLGFGTALIKLPNHLRDAGLTTSSTWLESPKTLVIDYPTPGEPQYLVPIGTDDIVRFGPKALDSTPAGCRSDDCLITVVEYCDLSMSSCADMAPTAKAIIEKYQGRIRWAFRNVPQGNAADSQAAALAVLCAARQQKFWSFYDHLTSTVAPMTGQPTPAAMAQKPVTSQVLTSSAKEAGLDMTAYAGCIDGQTDAAWQFSERAAAARSLGVTGMPTIFVNGHKMSGVVPLQILEKRIEDLITHK